jgi:hypothetical protein
MFDSLKPWINVPFIFKPFIKRNGAGTKLFGDDIEAKCYPVGEVQLITDEKGAEVTSTTQLYVDGECPIKVSDEVTFEGSTHSIKRISTFYRNGTVDLKVVYL